MLKQASMGGAAALLTLSCGHLVVISACSDVPGNPEDQGAVIGGGPAGPGVAHGKPLVGGLANGLGASRVVLIGANPDKIKGNDRHSAEQAVQKSLNAPATAQEARVVTTADINNDGFVTVDEVIAMQNAGFTEDEVIRRLQITGQVFDLPPQNEVQLHDAGVSQNVMNQMKTMNR